MQTTHNSATKMDQEKLSSHFTAASDDDDDNNPTIDSLVELGESVHHSLAMNFVASNNCGKDMLSVINILIPKYRHIRRVFDLCSSALLSMVHDPRIQTELKLTSSVVESFIVHIMCAENEDYNHLSLCQILAVYHDSISISVFEKVFCIVVNNGSRRTINDRKSICEYLVDIPKYCNYDHIRVIKRVLGDEKVMRMKLLDMFFDQRYLIELFVRDFQTCDSFFEVKEKSNI